MHPFIPHDSPSGISKYEELICDEVHEKRPQTATPSIYVNHTTKKDALAGEGPMVGTRYASQSLSSGPGTHHGSFTGSLRYIGRPHIQHLPRHVYRLVTPWLQAQ